MNLAQFQIILQKINALDKNINMDGKISSIEKDLMKAYVSQLYEACVGMETSDASPTAPVVEQKVAEVNTPPPVQEQIQHQPAPVVIPEPPTPVAEPVAEVVEEVVQPVAQAEIVEEVVQAETSTTKTSVNESIAAPTKTIADAVSTTQGKSINDRLADINKSKTFNDKFTTEPAKSAAVPSKPKLVKIPDSLKHLDNTTPKISNVQQSITPPPVPTPIPVPTPEPTPTPVQQKVTSTPVVKTKPATQTNLNEAFSLFDAATSGANEGKWGSSPIPDLAKSIGLNDKISMIKELFSDDQHAFNNALSQLNNIGGFEPAKDYMMRNLVTVYNWNQANKVERAKQFINLVHRRYK